MLTTCTMPLVGEHCSGRGSDAGDELTRWYAACTRLGHENRVACQLQARAIPFYLPVLEPASQRRPLRSTHRNATRILALFPGLIFVRMPWLDRALILGVPGVVSLVEARRHALPLPDVEIQTLQANLGQVHARPHPYLNQGVRVRVRSGPLCGLCGILKSSLKREPPRVRIVVTLEAINRSMVVIADGWELDPI